MRLRQQFLAFFCSNRFNSSIFLLFTHIKVANFFFEPSLLEIKTEALMLNK